MNTVTVVTQLINQARLQFGEIEALLAPEPLWEQVMDEVADAGGELGLDHCVVDGIKVYPRGEGAGTAVARLADGQARELTTGG